MSELNMTQLLDISDLPGVTGEEILVYPPLELKEVVSNPTNRNIDLEEDYKQTRQTLHHQQQMIMDAAKIFLETAKNADSPRHMEVFATLMSQVTNSSKELLKIHKEMKDITNETTNTKGSQQVNIENANIVMTSPTDLLEEFGDSYETKENAKNSGPSS
ncbi:terminase small subunit [Proteus phage phiP4-3]|uniref:Terminase small subunit n=1 Tax=Proteus phage phiP4-3 TaxID=2065203 RepID=A0A2I6PFF8_9CAUD|nr:terminase small subunit [Proteus phage phiP4-3]AUM58469.1 terminase small subunit [Proteus phage phiP4-3]AZV01287.1 terminase small subunit [Shigella phage vB_SdyM_006]